MSRSFDLIFVEDGGENTVQSLWLHFIIRKRGIYYILLIEVKI